jgi:hypothetical protein
MVMTLENAQAIIDSYAANTWLIQRHTEGLTHEESVLQPPFPANCLNWVLGHILHRRNSALELLGLAPLWTDEIGARYRSGSDPITDARAAREFSQLLHDLEETQRQLTAALESATGEVLERVAETDRGTKRVEEHLSGLTWHETYHVGQLDLLRAMILHSRSG